MSNSKLEATFHGETPDEQRRRILGGAPDCSPIDYDSAIILGYAPESWDGMWKLRADRPIIWLSRRWALACEVQYQPGTHRPRVTRRGRVVTRWRLRRAQDT